MFDTFLKLMGLLFKKIVLGGTIVLTLLGVEFFEPPTSAMLALQEQSVYVEQIKSIKDTAPEKENESPKAEIVTEASPQEKIVSAPIIEKPTQTIVLGAAQPQEQLIPQAQLNEAARKTIVNVFCLTKASSVFEPITGSGVFIDKRGVILTNAHVAQYFLLKDYKIKDFLECVIRTGSPAIPLYKAELLYLPPAWIEKNALNIILDKPMGTGENDFALLLVTGRTATGAALPEVFPVAPFEVGIENVNVGNPVLLASYPAGFLGGLNITKNLWITSSVANIMRLFTFKETAPYTEDAFSIGGTIVAQEGASGGGVFSLKSGNLIGLLATSLLEGNTAERDLRAISLRHINERMQTFTGKDLQTFLSGDVKQKSAEFNGTVAPQLTKILVNVLDTRE